MFMLVSALSRRLRTSRRRGAAASRRAAAGSLRGAEPLETRTVLASTAAHFHAHGLAAATHRHGQGAAHLAPHVVHRAPAPAVTVASTTPGANAFISFVTLAGGAVPTVASVRFEVAPKSGSTTTPISATYTRAYLRNHGYVDAAAGTITVPVYGLYADRTNSVSLSWTGPRPGSLTTTVTTAAWENGLAGLYQSKETVVARDPSIPLGYSYFMLKAWGGGTHPIVMDTDGEVRWAGTAGGGDQGSMFFRNGFYVGEGSTLRRIELDGTFTTVAEYGTAGYSTFHHNIDPGKRGMLIDFDRPPNVESDIVEVDAAGQILNSWDFAAIISSAMRAGGDDPSAFVRIGDDWFHNNAAAYWPAQNVIVASSRENFVIAVGYDDKQIKWILGDTSKAWYAYPSLRRYALQMTGTSVAPVGQHAVSITPNNQLLLFDNGMPSFNQSPAGDGRNEAVPRRYRIDPVRMTATETWRFEHSPAVYSPICSSIYQDGASYLVNYASENWGQAIRLVGLDQRGRTAFEYKLNGLGWPGGWNAKPIRFQRTVYA